MRKNERTQKVIFGRWDHWVKLVNDILDLSVLCLTTTYESTMSQNKMVNLKIGHEFKGSLALFYYKSGRDPPSSSLYPGVKAEV